MAYCATTDLLAGDIPLTGLDAAKFVNDAADEIDSQIGFRYLTPVASDAARPVLLLLKRINAHLATGRMIMAADAAGQRSELHAYGESLVREALASLAAIAGGMVDLPVTPFPSNANDQVEAGPLIYNVDPVSQVEAFYGAFSSATNPGYYPGAGG